jgi:DNA repair exonuclease SbcCD ATPase subunit
MPDANTLAWLMTGVSLLFMIWLALRAETRRTHNNLETRESQMLREMNELRRRIAECEENERKLKAANADLHNVMRMIATQNTEWTERVATLETELKTAVSERDKLRERNGHLEYMLDNLHTPAGSAEPGAGLRNALASLFSVSELQALCADLGATYEDMDGDGKASKALSIYAHFQRRGELAQLTAAVKQKRPRAQV